MVQIEIKENFVYFHLNDKEWDIAQRTNNSQKDYVKAENMWKDFKREADCIGGKKAEYGKFLRTEGRMVVYKIQ
jgi:hypothetical protein